MSSRIDAREMQYMPITLGELHATSAVEVPHTEDCLFSFDEDMLAIREVFAADTGEHEPITSDPHFSGGYLTNDISARVQDEHVAMRSSGPYEVITRPSVDPQWQTTLRDEEDDLSSCIPMTSLKRFDTIDQEMIKLFQVHDDNPPAPHPEVTDSSDDETNLSENSKRTFSIATTNEKSNPKKWIDHTYIDFSLVEQQHLLGNRSPQGSTLKAVLEANPDCITLKHGKFQGSINFPTNFPYKMMEILSRPEIKNIIDWRPHGRSFIIYHPEKMENKVLVFSKYKSFVRSLNMWGFKRITRGPDAGSYYHQLFLRGKRFLLQYMQCLKNKGYGKRRSPNPSDEPDFFALAKIRPLQDPRAVHVQPQNVHSMLPYSDHTIYTGSSLASPDAYVISASSRRKRVKTEHMMFHGDV